MADDKRTAKSGGGATEGARGSVEAEDRSGVPGDRARVLGETVGDRELRSLLRNIGLRLAATGPTREAAGRGLATARRSEVYAVLELLIEDVQTMTGMDDEAAAGIIGGIIGDLRYILPLLPERWSLK